MGWPEWIVISLMALASVLDFGRAFLGWKQQEPFTEKELALRSLLRPLVWFLLLWWGGFFA